VIRAQVLSVECDSCEREEHIHAGMVEMADHQLYAKGQIALMTLAVKYAPCWHFGGVHLCKECVARLKAKHPDQGLP
jgi:hypothetical protein